MNRSMDTFEDHYDLHKRSIRSTSLASSIVALLLSPDSLIALLFPLWVVGRERLPRTKQERTRYSFVFIQSISYRVKPGKTIKGKRRRRRRRRRKSG